MADFKIVDKYLDSSENFLKHLEEKFKSKTGNRVFSSYVWMSEHISNAVRENIIPLKQAMVSIGEEYEDTSYTKYINPDFLYSNEEFMLGFIEGIINGDGCIYKQEKSIIRLCSLPLISQLRIVLSYFVIFTSFLYKKSNGQIVFRTGAGIVADSVPENELLETRAKAQGLLNALGIEDHVPH